MLLAEVLQRGMQLLLADLGALRKRTVQMVRSLFVYTMGGRMRGTGEGKRGEDKDVSNDRRWINGVPLGSTAAAREGCMSSQSGSRHSPPPGTSY